MSSVEDRVLKIVGDQLQVKTKSITSETKFEDLNADSLDMVELAIAIEEEFDIEIPDEDVEKLITFGQAVDYVRKALPLSADA